MIPLPIEPITLSGVMGDLSRRGVTDQLTLGDGRLREVNPARSFAAEHVTNAEY